MCPGCGACRSWGRSLASTGGNDRLSVCESYLSFVVGAVDVADRSIMRNNAAGDADGNTVIGNVAGHHTVGSNRGEVAHVDLPHDFRTGTDVDVVADRRAALFLSSVCDAQRDAVRDITVLADHTRLVHHDAAKMADVESAPNLRLERNRDAELVGVAHEHGMRDRVINKKPQE